MVLVPLKSKIKKIRQFLPSTSAHVKKPVSTKPTVVVHGMSRSGTTMLNVLLDSHPDIAMCYDVVPQIFEKPLSLS